jgi:ribose transport system permease protein
MLTKTTIGRAIYAVGGNAAAAKLSGISIGRVTLTVYVICGVMAALTGIMMGSRLGSAQPSVGTGQEMIVIAACIVGGTSTFGGRGTILGTAIGAFFMNMLTNSMTLMHVNIYYQNLVVGAVLVVAVVLDQYARDSSRRGARIGKKAAVPAARENKNGQ